MDQGRQEIAELDPRLDADESDGVKGRTAAEVIAAIRKKLWPSRIRGMSETTEPFGGRASRPPEGPEARPPSQTAPLVSERFLIPLGRGVQGPHRHIIRSATTFEAP